MTLVWPSQEYLAGYVAALELGWSADNVRGKDAADEELAKIAADSAAFLVSLVDREAMGDPVGYAVVPWKQRRGYATSALRQLLPDAAAEGLRYVEITTDPDNVASRRVIESNGGRLIERFIKPAQFGSLPGLRYRIDLHEEAAHHVQL